MESLGGGWYKDFFLGVFGCWMVEVEAGTRERNEAGEESGMMCNTHLPLAQLPRPTLMAAGHLLVILSVAIPCYLGDYVSTSVSSSTLLLTHKALVLGCWFLVKAGVRRMY